MILSKRQRITIERHLFGAEEDKADLEQRRADIIERGRIMERSGGHEGCPADPTAAMVVQLDRELSRLEGWVYVAGATFERFKDTPKGGLMQKRYVERLPWWKTCRQLHITKRTYYDWRDDVVTYAALVAVKRNVFQV